MKRFIAVLLIALLLGLCACVKQEENLVEDLDAIREEGILRIGVTQSPPFAAGKEAQWEGFDIALVEKLCRELDLEAKVVELNWGERWEALEDRTVDCLMGGLSATDDLLAQVDLTETYLVSYPVLVSLSSDEADFQGARIAVESDSAGELAVEMRLEGAQTLPASSQLEALKLVADGKAKAAVVDHLIALAVQEELGLVILEKIDLGVEELTIALRKGSDLTDEINDALRELHSLGVLEELAQDYGLTEGLIQG